MKKMVSLVILTVIEIFALNVALSYVQSQWTSASMELVRQNMGDLVPIRANMNAWSLFWWVVLAAGVIVILVPWVLAYRKQFTAGLMSLSMLVLIVLAIPFFVACSSSNFVNITPPNFAIVVDMSNTNNQATGNKFDNKELVDLTQVPVYSHKCATDSSDYCPDKMVIEVEGSPQSRLYTKNSTSGTSGSNQALCFEASGANGCLDFSVNAVILKNDAPCYANKMGVTAVSDPPGQERFHFKAKSLSEALDTRVIQKAAEVFAQKVATVSPLTLALDKFKIFNDAKQEIIKAIYDQTCITMNDVAIINGIQWDDQAIQDQINQATIIANQLDLVAQQNKLQQAQTQAFIDRAEMMEKQFGLPAAIEFMRIQKWDGSYLPALPGNPSVTSTPLPPIAVTPVVTPSK